MIIPNKIELANIPTPIHSIFYDGFEILIKRDDYTGSELSGNKVRKLEYLFFDILNKDYDCVISVGGVQSNHCRATAAAAAKFGLKCVLILFGKKPKSFDGNLAMMVLFGAELIFIDEDDLKNIDQIVDNQIEKLKKKGIKAYYIPAGGSSELGIWGYIEFVKELKYQLRTFTNKPSHIISAVGSGGTLAGLTIGKKLFNIKSQIVGVTVLNDAVQMRKNIVELANSCSEKYKLGISITENDFLILDGYSSEGYEKITDEKILTLNDIALENGILLDPTYTGKAFYGMIDHFIVKGNDFNKLLFIHTGGIFGVFAKIKQYLKNLI